MAAVLEKRRHEAPPGTRERRRVAEVDAIRRAALVLRVESRLARVLGRFGASEQAAPAAAGARGGRGSSRRERAAKAVSIECYRKALKRDGRLLLGLLGDVVRVDGEGRDELAGQGGGVKRVRPGAAASS